MPLSVVPDRLTLKNTLNLSTTFVQILHHASAHFRVGDIIISNLLCSSTFYIEMAVDQFQDKPMLCQLNGLTTNECKVKSRIHTFFIVFQKMRIITYLAGTQYRTWTKKQEFKAFSLWSWHRKASKRCFCEHGKAWHVWVWRNHVLCQCDWLRDQLEHCGHLQTTRFHWQESFSVIVLKQELWTCISLLLCVCRVLTNELKWRTSLGFYNK